MTTERCKMTSSNSFHGSGMCLYIQYMNSKQMCIQSIFENNSSDRPMRRVRQCMGAHMKCITKVYIISKSVKVNNDFYTQRDAREEDDRE